MKNIWGLFLFIAFARLVAALTNNHWAHPDEWYQTVEFGNWIAHDVMSGTQESWLHLRNLSLPMFFAGVLKLSEFLSPQNVALRLFLVQFASGLVDLVMLFSMAHCLSALWSTSIRSNYIWGAVTLAGFSWFSVVDGVRPSQEHFAAAMFWCCLWAALKGRVGVAGFLAVGIFAMRYSAGLLGAGLLASLAYEQIRNREIKEVGILVCGVFVGILFWGVPDAIFYGRPWESFYQYFIYNVSSGLSSRYFGDQSAVEYFRYFGGHWGGRFAPFFVILLLGFLVGFGKPLRAPKEQIVMWRHGTLALLFFLAGHLWTSHKEPRFMAPIEWLVFWPLLIALPQRLSAFFSNKSVLWKRATAVLVAATWLPHGAAFVRAAWGHVWSAAGTYREISSHVMSVKPCAVISVTRPISVRMMWDRGAQPMIAHSYFPMDRKESWSSALKNKPLIWVDREPACGPKDVVLVHSHKALPKSIHDSCETLTSSVLKFSPKELWGWLERKDFVRGAWLQCSQEALSQFSKTETRKVLFRGRHKLASLPHWKSDGNAFQAWADSTITYKTQDGTLGDW